MPETNAFAGVVPVHGVGFEIDTTNGSVTPTWVTIADLESAELSVDTGVETWNSLSEGGWQRALATAKSYKIAVSGKRKIGDTGNDYVAGKLLATGQDCSTKMRFTFPNGDTLIGGVVISVTACGAGKSTDVGPLNFDLTSDGRPTYTPYTSGTT